MPELKWTDMRPDLFQTYTTVEPADTVPTAVISTKERYGKSTEDADNYIITF